MSLRQRLTTGTLGYQLLLEFGSERQHEKLVVEEVSAYHLGIDMVRG